MEETTIESLKAAGEDCNTAEADENVCSATVTSSGDQRGRRESSKTCDITTKSGASDVEDAKGGTVADIENGVEGEASAEAVSDDAKSDETGDDEDDIAAIERIVRHKSAEYVVSSDADGELPKPKHAWPTDLHFDFSKQGVSDVVKYMILLIFLAFLRALTTHVFIIPNGFAPGGIGGISSIIYNAVLPYNPKLANTLLDPGLTTFLMNIPILVAAFFRLNKKFAINTFFVIAFYSGFMMIFNAIPGFPQFYAGDDTGLKIIGALVGGAATGFCLGIMLRTNMSMGGTDIIGKFIYKHNPSAGAMWWILICDCTVAACSGLLGILELLDVPNITATVALTYVLSPILFSFLSLIICSFTADFIQSGFQSSLVFNIITDKPREIAEAISQHLHRGVTISRAVGYYTGVEHEVLVCVVSKKQINIVKRIVQTADPNSFTFITKASEVAGKGFRHAPEDN